MIKNMSSKSFMILSIAAIILLLGPLGNTAGSALKDAVQGALMGTCSVIAVAGLWLAGSKN
ncbi:hypothetical protein [Paenibacillus polymyxa]|uniref:hypothetical protein n=1 Tax=Paenibacillus polymyxa TaxID=1406 RepID=UPI003217A960